MNASEYNAIASETELQIQVIEYINYQYPGTLYHHSANEGKRTVVNGSKLKKMGMSKGFPDVAILEPRGDYHGLFLELKRDKTCKLTTEQRLWLTRLKLRKYQAFKCTGFDEAKQVIDSYMRLPYGAS